MSLFICLCAAVFGLIWAVRHPCKSMTGVWVRRGLGILCFALALVPVFFLAGTAGVRQETPYEFELESMEEAYTAREFLEEEADWSRRLTYSRGRVSSAAVQLPCLAV